MTTENRDIPTPEESALIEAIASYACEGIVLSDVELHMILQLDSENLSDDEKIARMKASLTESPSGA